MMHKRRSLTNLNDQFDSKAGQPDSQDGYRHSIESACDWEKNWATEIPLRPGLKLIVTNAAFLKDSTICFDMDRSPLIFCFPLFGKSRSIITHGGHDKTTIHARKGFSSLSYFPKSKGVSEYSPETPALLMHLQVEPALMRKFMEGEFDTMPVDFRSIAEGKREKSYYWTGVMTPSMKIALHQILNCRFQGFTKKLFIESKVLELMALQLEQYFFQNNSCVNSPFLQPLDIDRIHEAMAIIVADMQNPPSLSKLAARVGLNDFKLKIGFRQVCGKTAFSFLHDYRMEKSRKLLGQGQMNVKEVSYEVGYKDPGRFSDAFKNFFGVRPSDYRRSEGLCRN